MEKHEHNKNFDDFFIKLDDYFKKEEYRQYVVPSESDKTKIINYINKIMNILYKSKLKYTTDQYSYVEKKLKERLVNPKVEKDKLSGYENY